MGDWSIQQAYSIDKYNFTEAEPIAITEKLNGVHGTFYDGKFISVNGLEICGLEHIVAEINQLFHGEVVLEGELIRKNIDGKSNSENFTIGTGIINSHGSKECIEFIIFDIILKKEFDDNDSKISYLNRIQILKDLKDTIESLKLQNVKVVPIYYVGDYNPDIVTHWLNYAVENDIEGVMVGRDVMYKRTRNKGLLKVKKFYTMDLPIVGMVEGVGRLKGTLGSIIVDYKGNQVGVGGFDDAKRRQIWSNRESFIGRICEVKYKGISKNKKTGMDSLQFPTFVRFREDGKTVSYD